MKETQAGWPAKQMRCFLAAMRFLTIIPVVRGAELDGEYFKESLLYFPVIGLIIGSLCSLLTIVSQLFLPQQVVASIVVTFLAFISGCLHLDGLSDSGDGLLSSRPRDRSMEIMKDSRVGAMGVIVTVIVLLTKYSALTSIDSVLMPVAVFFMPFAGRVMILCTMALLPYAREEGGLGNLFYSRLVRRFALYGVIALLACLVVFSPQRLLLVVFFLAVTFVFFNTWCKNKIGGATGDTLGANCELAEMVVAIAFSATLSVTL
ncbi:adenosylcobinamide-GDP ribazoletransferase [Desulforhopalus sp. 52FAK]